MAEMVSMRVQTSTQSQGQASHDFSGRPQYAIESKIGLNKTIFGGSEKEVKGRIESQSRAIKNSYNEIADKNRDVYKTTRYRRRVGSWRKGTAFHKTAIITFSKDVRIRDNQKLIDREELDACALKFFKNMCKYNHCELTYIVRHDDESTPHYHAMFTNVCDYVDVETEKRVIKPLKFEMRNLSELQDRVGECFATMGMTRGVKRNERLDIARNNNPQYLEESNEDYKKRIYKLANVVYRKVAQLHEDLPKEIDALNDKIRVQAKQINDQQAFFDDKQAELEEKMKFILGKLEKVTKNLSNAETKLKNTEDEDTVVKGKMEKNIRTYERRISNLSAELAEIEAESRKIKALVMDEKQELKVLAEQEKSKIESIDRLTLTPINPDIAKNYELVTPKKYNANAKRVIAHEISVLDREKAIELKESELEHKTQELKRREVDINQAITLGVMEYVNSNAIDISSRVIEKTKMWIDDSFVQLHEQTNEFESADIERVQKQMVDFAKEDINDSNEFEM